MEPVYPSFSIWDYEWIMLTLISNFYCSKTSPVKEIQFKSPRFVYDVHTAILGIAVPPTCNTSASSLQPKPE